MKNNFKRFFKKDKRKKFKEFKNIKKLLSLKLKKKLNKAIRNRQQNICKAMAKYVMENNFKAIFLLLKFQMEYVTIL